MRFWRRSAASGGGWRSWRRSTRSFSPTSTPATASSRSSRTWRSSSASYADGIEASPARLQQVEERLALLERLKRKYGPDLADVIARRDALRARARATSRAATTPGRRSSVSSAAARAAYLDGSAERCRPRAVGRRGDVRDSARRAARRPGDGADPVRGALRRRPLAEARGPRAASTRREFFVSPNPGEDLRPLARIVSGGELSRVMLAIKTLTATSRHGFSDAATAAERGGAGADLRRSRRRHRRPRRRRRRTQAARARVGVPGALHHAPAADRGVRRHALPDREAGRAAAGRGRR